MLFILFNDGKYLLIDPSNGQKKEYALEKKFTLEENYILKSKVFDMGCVFFSNNY